MFNTFPSQGGKQRSGIEKLARRALREFTANSAFAEETKMAQHLVIRNRSGISLPVPAIPPAASSVQEDVFAPAEERPVTTSPVHGDKTVARAKKCLATSSSVHGESSVAPVEKGRATASSVREDKTVTPVERCMGNASPEDTTVAAAEESCTIKATASRHGPPDRGRARSAAGLGGTAC